jgi:hypothetical protein
MKFIISLFIIILNLSVASAEIMDVGDSGIYPVYDYVDNTHHPRSRTDELKEEIENDEIFKKIKCQEYCGLSQGTIDYLKEETQQKNLKTIKLDAESEIKFYNKKIKCLMDDIPPKECSTFLKKSEMVHAIPI